MLGKIGSVPAGQHLPDQMRASDSNQASLQWKSIGWVAADQLHLLVSNARQVPDHQPSVRSAGRQDRLVLGAPADLEHLLGVVVEGVQGLAQIPEIMQRHLALQHSHLACKCVSDKEHMSSASLSDVLHKKTWRWMHLNLIRTICCLLGERSWCGDLTVLSAEPVASTNSLKGLKPRQLTSASCASTCCALAAFPAM